MSKRLFRIPGGKIFSTLHESLPTAQVSAVTRHGNSVSGKIESLSTDALTITDGRSHKHHLALTDLYEIVYDKVEP